MARKTSRLSRTRWIALLVCLGPWVPGCAGGRTLDGRPDATRIAQRPVYPIEGTRPLYLGGYAGANYDRASRPSR